MKSVKLQITSFILSASKGGKISCKILIALIIKTFLVAQTKSRSRENEWLIK